MSRINRQNAENTGYDMGIALQKKDSSAIADYGAYLNEGNRQGNKLTNNDATCERFTTGWLNAWRKTEK